MYMFNMHSAGGLDVQKHLSCLQIQHENSRFKGDKDTVVINWGCGSELPREVTKCHIINKPEAIYNAIDKRAFLRLCTDSGVRTVPWSTDSREAQRWISRGDTVYCRTRLEGRQGQGIVICDSTSPLVTARLYTKYIPSTREYRVHVVDGEVIAVHRKIHDGETAITPETEKIRNTANGWLFARRSEYPGDICVQAKAAVAAVGLDFAVVDVLWGEERLAYVLEANTAPGIDTMDWTCAQYAKALKSLASKKLKDA
jgi:glutathione synthase/RimK-type ligase-like ATP-grasp enzyme